MTIYDLTATSCLDTDGTTTSAFSTPLLDERSTTAVEDVAPSAVSSMIVVATVIPLAVVLTIVLMTLTIIVVLAIMLQRKKGKKTITEEQRFDNANNC